VNNHRERVGLFWPVLLVSAGAVLLLNNLGLLEWSLWEMLLRLWPAILVALGIDLLIPKRSAGSYLLALVLMLAAFGASYWLFTAAGPSSPESMQINEPLAASSAATLTLKPAVGELQLQGGAPAGVLARGSVSPLGRGQVRVDRRQLSGRAVLELSHEFGSGGWLILPDTRHLWELEINGEVPLELQAELGAGLMRLDLTSLNVQRVNASLGVGEAELKFASRPVSAKLEGGVGALRIVVPMGASVRIQLSRGLVSLTLPSGYELADGVANSPAAQSGTIGLDISVSLGVGTIQVVEEGG